MTGSRPCARASWWCCSRPSRWPWSTTPSCSLTSSWRRGVGFTAKELPVAPLLAVEVLSPSTRRVDLRLKRDRLEEAACGAYWCLDPVALTLVAWELVDGRFVEVASVAGDEVFEASRPFPVMIRPADLAASARQCAVGDGEPGAARATLRRRSPSGPVASSRCVDSRISCPSVTSAH